jgi:hypothetical protein
VAPYRPYGGGSATPKGQKKRKKKRKKMGFGLWGWPKPPPTAGRGCSKPPPGPRGWSGHPQRPKRILSFFFFLAFWGGRTTPKGRSHPHTAGMGWPKPPLGQKWGGPATPLLGRGWLQPPRFPLLFLFFLFFFQKKKNLKCKTTPFCPKQRRFGRAQNGVVLEWRV